MRCETCGQEKPTPAYVVGDFVEIINNGIWNGIGVVRPSSSYSDWPYVLLLTGEKKGTCAYFHPENARVVHGYIHINRTEMDFTRHAL